MPPLERAFDVGPQGVIVFDLIGRKDLQDMTDQSQERTARLLHAAGEPRPAGHATNSTASTRAPSETCGRVALPALFDPQCRRGYSKEKMRFQSPFMLITVQSRAFASSISETENVPTLVSGRSPAGP